MSQDFKSKPIRLESWVGFLSSFSEAYIMSLVAFLAPTLAPLLFKDSTRVEGIFSSYTLIFLGSFIMYPLGAWYYGNIGDSKGRRKACTSSSLGLAAVTGAMALLPLSLNINYSWVLFMIFLCAQFFFSAGEYYSSIVFSLEHGSLEQQGLMSGISCSSSVLGILLASGISILVTQYPNEISWRFPFFIGLLTGSLSFAFKYFCKESPYFNLHKIELKTTSWSFVKENYLVIISLTFITGLFFTIYSYVFLFLPLIYRKNIDTNPTLETFICLIFYAAVLLSSGYLADKFKINRIMIFGALSFVLVLAFFIPFFHSIPFLTRLLLTIFAAIYIGPIHSWVIHQSHPDKRCRITSISTAFASAFFSHSCVILCMFFYQKFMSLWISSIYIFGLAAIALFILLKVRSKTEFSDKSIPVTVDSS